MKSSARPDRVILLIRLALAVLVGAAGPAGAAGAEAPEYALSGRAEALSKVVLARTSMGPVTALDVLMFDALTSRALAAIPAEHWLAPDSLAAETSAPAMRRAVEVLVTHDAVARRAGDWLPAEDQLRVMSFGAAKAAWIELVVTPQIRVLDADVNRYYLAHPERYLRQQPLRVRYIFRSSDAAGTTATADARQLLEQLAQRVRDGRTRFEDAASSFSQADSAREGGLLPLFGRGSFFPDFEDRAFELEEPGQMSPVFDGPGGLYLLQLVERRPPHNIPIEDVAGSIRETLQYDHVRHYYPYLLGQLRRQTFTRDSSPFWDYLDFQTPIVQVGQTGLSRNDLMRFYGNPTGADLATRPDVVVVGAADWLEGELVLRDLERRGWHHHDWIARARELAATVLRVRHVVAAEVPPQRYATIEAVRATLAANPAFTGRLRAARLIHFQVRAELAGDMAPSAVRRAEALASTLDAQIGQGYLPTADEPISLAERIAMLPPDDETAWREVVRGLDQSAGATPWPDVRIRVEDGAWQFVLPETAWWDLLARTHAGQVSPPLTIANTHHRFLVVLERPIDPALIESQQTRYKTLAFEAESMAIVLRARDALRRSGAIQFEF